MSSEITFDKDKNPKRLPFRSESTPNNSLTKRFHRVLWRRFLLIPFVTALPVALLVTGLNTNYDYARVVQESFSGRPSPTTRSYHVKLGWNYTLLAVFALLVSVGLFQLANTVLTRLEASQEQLEELKDRYYK